ncbi:MAG: hypothetical protein U9Q67_03555 [Patescibacteria group bacterium]|nr:hypothetical protein [Patescibacteria group bacterium]
MNLPEDRLPYLGGGSISFNSRYDEDKMEYLDELGFQLPDNIGHMEGSVIYDRALFITMFIVISHVIVMASIEKDGNDLNDILPGVNLKLHEHRINHHGDRDELADGHRVEDYYRELGFSCNPTLRVSQEELHEIVRWAFAQLSE